MSVDIEQAIISKLEGDTATVALIANRIYPSYVKQADRLYPLAICRVEITPVACFDGPSGIEYATVKIAAVGKTWKSAAAVADAIHTALEAQRGTWGGVVVQGCYLQDNGIETGIETDATSEAILYHIRGLAFDLSYST